MIFDKSLLSLGILLTIFGGYLLVGTVEEAESLSQVESPSISEQRESLLEKQPGSIVFDSNRSGSFGIFITSDAGKTVEVLVDSPAHEMFPSVSADGAKVVYGRTESLERGAPAEIWMLDRPNGKALKLAANGTFPTFSADDAKVYFERGRSAVIEFDLASQQEKQIFPNAGNGAGSAFAGFQVVKPRVAEDGKQVLFTSDKGGRWHAFSASLENAEFTNLGRGCEPVAFPEKNKIAWVKITGMRGGSGLNSYLVDQKSSLILHDREDPFGHEYFPTISDDGRFLLFSASPSDQHSHQSANYQLFVKDLESGELHRITDDGHTNRWPKLVAEIR